MGICVIVYIDCDTIQPKDVYCLKVIFKWICVFQFDTCKNGALHNGKCQCPQQFTGTACHKGMYKQSALPIRVWPRKGHTLYSWRATCVRQFFDWFAAEAANPTISSALLFFLYFDSKCKLGRLTDHVTAQITLQCDFLTLKITLLWSSDVQILYPWLCRCCCAIYVGSDSVSIQTTFHRVVEDSWVLRRHRAFTLSLFAVFHWLKKSHPRHVHDPIYNQKWHHPRSASDWSILITQLIIFTFFAKLRLCWCCTQHNMGTKHGIISNYNNSWIVPVLNKV